MKIEVELPDAYQPMIETIVDDTKKQNPDRDDIDAESVLAQICRKFVVESYAQVMINLPNEEEPKK